MALRDFNVTCTKMIREQTDAPSGGGKINSWRDGERFDAAIAVHTSREIIEANDLKGDQSYSVFVDKNMSFELDDYFRNESNGRYMRIASLDKRPPVWSTLIIKVFYGEYVDTLPN